MTDLHLQVYISPTHPIPGSDRTFSPTTSTLIYGDTDAVLVDASFLDEDANALAELIKSTGRQLRTVFVTHGHGDHWYGSHRLRERLGDFDLVATPAVAAHVAAHLQQETALWTGLFGDALTVPDRLPQGLHQPWLDLEGHRLPIVEVPQGDIAPCAVLHIPALDTVVAGDVAYNQIHQMLAFGGPHQWQQWIASVNVIAALQPRTVIAGHKKPGAPDDSGPVLDGTRAYLRDFTAAAASATTARDLVEQIQALYPDHGNLTTLIVSAAAAVKGRNRATR